MKTVPPNVELLALAEALEPVMPRWGIPPTYMRLTRRGSTQTIASGSWVNRYFDTVEYANSGSGIAGSDLMWMH